MNHEDADCEIFINYRQRNSSNELRSHTILVEGLSHRLARHFGEDTVFIDTSMRAGTLYPEKLRAKLTTCHALLAVIHAEWLEDLRQRQDRPGPDWVFDEINTALNGDPHAENHTARRPAVIPVLLENAELPHAEELPENIRELANLEAFRFRSGSLADDITNLVERLEDHVPASWEPRLEGEGGNFSQLATWIPMGVPAITLFILNLLKPRENSERLLQFLWLMTMSVSILALFFLGAIISWIFEGWSYRMVQQFHAQPARQSLLIGGLSLIGFLMLVFYPVLRIQIDARDSFRSILSMAIMFFAVFLLIFLLMMSHVAEGSREDLEWPPKVPIHRAPAWESSIRRAVVRLEEQLTSSWRPRLSRVQRDQAQHTVRQLSKAVAVLRAETEFSRLDWLRAEHRRPMVVTYAIWLAGTIGLAAASLYMLVSMEHNGSIFDLSRLNMLDLLIPTLVVAPAICYGTMELTYRYQRRESNRLATEIEVSLRDRVLPHLPPHA